MDASTAVGVFIDDLTNWYVRRSRRRFWKSEHDSDKNDAYATLYHVLVKLARAAGAVHALCHRGDVPEPGALRVPSRADECAHESVHHTRWPQVRCRGGG